MAVTYDLLLVYDGYTKCYICCDRPDKVLRVLINCR